MGLAEDTMARLGERHAAERVFVREITRRFDRVAAAAVRARMALQEADRCRAAVLAEWASAPGWSVGRVAEVAGLSQREVSDAIRASTGPACHGDIRPGDTSPLAVRPPQGGRGRPPDAAPANVA
jgi:AraC-like DNA-binding protein